MFVAALVMGLALAVDASTLDGKVLLGYQGWFRTPGDGSGAGWSHWGDGEPTAESVRVDLYPDLAEFAEKALAVAPKLTIGGRPAVFFSSYNPRVVRKHFDWMRDYGLDGVLAQRFLSDIPRLRREKDQVLGNVRASAEATGRVFAVEYDISGAREGEFAGQLQADWTYLTTELKLTASKAYLRQGGKPVVSIWGMGLNEPNHPPVEPAAAAEVVAWFKKQGCYVVGGTPAFWRTLDRDSRAGDGWRSYYQALDAVQPWTVGRFRSLGQASAWGKERYAPDQADLASRGQRYMPVVFPGFSWHNLFRKSAPNEIPRLGGAFLWSQAVAAQRGGARTLKIAMFDEVNEGTAVFKAAARRSLAPDEGWWLTLDADGEKLPSDWYLRLAGQITKAFRTGKALPSEVPRS